MSFIKKLIFLCLCLNHSTAHGFIHKQFYTLSPYVKAYGPAMDSFYDRQDYNDNIFPIILERAHLKALPYFKMKDYDAYWSYLVLGIMVPFHEGLNIHFRKIQSTHDCFDHSNSGDILKHLPKTRKLFFRTLKQTDPPQIPGCRLLDPAKEHLQILHAADGSDIGIMQVSIYWHANKFLAKNKHLDVRESLDYGLDLLKTSFNYIYRRLDRFPCLTKGKDPLKPANYVNLIKGAWAGYYNSGDFDKSCRFEDANDPWAKNDRRFKANLTNLLNYDPDNQVDHSGLKLSQGHAKILKKIIERFEKSADNNRFLTDYLSDSQKAQKNMRIHNPPHYTQDQSRGIVLTRLKVRTKAPENGRLAPFSGIILEPRTRIIIDLKQTLPSGEVWYKLSSPVNGWASGNPSYIDLEERL